MPYYEVVFESGRVSVMGADDDAAALEAVGEQDKRAREGGQGGPQGGPAERVTKLFKYAKHPNEFNPEQTASADVLKTEVGALIDALADANGVVSLITLSQEVRGLAHPMQGKEHPHDSQFKMESEAVLTLDGGSSEPESKGKK